MKDIDLTRTYEESKSIQLDVLKLIFLACMEKDGYTG